MEAIQKSSSEKTKYNAYVARLLTFALSFPLLTTFFGGISNSIGISSVYGTYLIYLTYLFLLALTLLNLKSKNKLGNITVTSISLILVFILNYLLFEESQIYFTENATELFINLLVFLPLANLLIYVNDWSPFFKEAKKIAYLTPVFSAVSLFIFNVGSYTSYMEFSNTLLAGALLSFYYFKKDKKHKPLWLIISIFDVILIFAYGARMALVSMVVFIVLLEFISTAEAKISRKKALSIISLSLLFLVILAFFDEILGYIVTLFGYIGFDTSYIIKSIFSGSFFESQSRVDIYMGAIQELKAMGFNIYGLFGDRIAIDKYGFSGGHTTNYVHNIFLEILLSFGWVLGSILIIFICSRIIFGIFKKSNGQYSSVLLFMVCLVFMRLLVSGSFIIDGRFILLFSLFLNPDFTKAKSKAKGYSLENTNRKYKLHNAK